MKKAILKTIILTLILFTVISCNDPVFYAVSQNRPILPPLIDGAAKKFVLFPDSNNVLNMFTASGRILWGYSTNNRPSYWLQFGTFSFIRDITATANYLYICHDSGGQGVLSRTNFKNAVEEHIFTSADVQAIFGAGDHLLISVREYNNYGIYFMPDSGSAQLLNNASDVSFGIIKGVAASPSGTGY